MKKIRLLDIIITEAFANSHPSDEKVQKYRKEFAKTGKQSKFLVINKYNVLIDGYIQYLILKENGIEEAEYIRSNRKNVENYRNEMTTYIYGKHENSNCDKEFMWRVPKSMTWFSENVQVGDSILCQTKFGIAPVIVTKVEVLDKCPVDFRVKRIAKCMIRRDGYTVEP